MQRKRIDIIIQVSGPIDRLYKILGILSTIEKPANITFKIGLLFINPWLVEEFCKHNWKQFENIKLYLSDADMHTVEHITEYCQQNKVKLFFPTDDSTLIEDDFYFVVCHKLGVKWTK